MYTFFEKKITVIRMPLSGVLAITSGLSRSRRFVDGLHMGSPGCARFNASQPFLDSAESHATLSADKTLDMLRSAFTKLDLRKWL